MQRVCLVGEFSQAIKLLSIQNPIPFDANDHMHFFKNKKMISNFNYNSVCVIGIIHGLALEF
jgi:hypothetical protein